MTKDVTNLFDRYRECSRHLFNMYFRELPDPEDLFENIDRDLFFALVLAPLDLPWEERLLDNPNPRFRVVPQLGTFGVSVLINNPRPDDPNWYWDHSVNCLEDDAIRLDFVQYFEFRGPDQPRDLQYYRTRIVDFPAHAELVGRDLLIDTSYAKVFLVE